MQPIFLIGFMGSGKSTLGRALATATGYQFIDLDSYIEVRYHSNIRDIFASRGEDGFRDIERRMLHEVSDFEDVIVACGGGTPCFFDNMDRMNAHGLTVMLTATHETLLRRLLAGRRRRPLIASMDDARLGAFIEESIGRRMPFYSKASHFFPSDRLESRQQIAETVADFISRFIPQCADNHPTTDPTQ